MTDGSDPAVDAAQAYENLHVGALFEQWVAPTLGAAGVTSGDHVLDVACGTGVVARAAVGRVGSSGSVTGLDIAPGMLAVAASIEPRVTWTEGDAGKLPFDDDRFDAVVSQFGLMFFPDRVRAVREMVRCTKPGGRTAIAVWDAIERSEAYLTLADLLEEHAGLEAADAVRVPFSLGDTDRLRDLCRAADVNVASVTTAVGQARFPSVRTMVEAELRGWLPVMGVILEDDLIGELLALAESALGSKVSSTGEMVFDVPAHHVTVLA